jgi:hypothetical protein
VCLASLIGIRAWKTVEENASAAAASAEESKDWL